jgi:PAS domain S-box-containing protein
MTDYLKLHSDYQNKGTFSKLMLDSTFDGFFFKSPDNIITYWNNGAEKIFGYTQNEILGKNISMLVPQNKSEELLDIMKKIKEGVKIEHLETQRLAKDGTIKELIISVNPIFENGNLIGAAVFHKDISVEKQTERKFNEIFEHSPDGQLIVNSDGIIAMASRQCEEMSGYTRNELIGQKIEILVPEKLRKTHVAHRDKFALESKSRRMGSGLKLMLRKKDGSEIPVDIMLSPIRMDNTPHVLAAVRNLSELKELAVYARSLIEASPDPFIVSNLDGIITDANKEAMDMLCIENEKISGHDFASCFTEPQSLKEFILKVIQLGRVKNTPLTVKDNKGKLLDFLVSASVCENYFGKKDKIFYVLKDISELIKIASKLISEESLSRLK